ncbi:hypothetical protein [Streptomyces sp. NBC_01408]|uniref:hypothetical protein n=1 Tax=Streptomyces sp. NBC_01408 TaxID=2903855 RepID=UPI0022568170|nr:hypothetical protein [Streptomyces sp. NBC_01408]MCX4692720.1 hypothetical protein [Streptomyces sp. NBC_01408]
MRARTWAVAAATATALITAAAPASAAGGGIPWSITHGTAKAEGDRSLARSATGVLELRVDGKLSRTGEGCSSVWVRFQFDMAPMPARKQAQVCGDGTADVNIRMSYMPTTTGYVTVCKGTEKPTDCAPWASISHWRRG